jgi:uncharacterized protein (DUF1778 family)
VASSGNPLTQIRRSAVARKRFDGFLGLSIARDDKELLESAARDSGETLSSFVRRVTKRAAREQLHDGPAEA